MSDLSQDGPGSLTQHFYDLRGTTFDEALVVRQVRTIRIGVGMPIDGLVCAFVYRVEVGGRDVMVVGGGGGGVCVGGMPIDGLVCSWGGMWGGVCVCTREGRGGR